ncbi:MAG: PAS domain S-box protein, partial [Anaerolineales bacterium]|nr:PAS domain S-box protein [Anaerolineales bacterium]
QPDLEALIITGNATLESAIQALANGAYHYFIKPLNPDELLVTLEQALHKQRLVIENRRLVLDLQQELAERKRAEEALRENEIKYHTQFEASMDAIFVETLEGKVLDCNDAACKMLGYSKAELTALTVADLVPEQVAQTLPAVITKELTTGGIFVEAFNKRKNGQMFPCEVSTRFVTIDGGSRVIAFVRDITERKRAEDARRAAEASYRDLFENVPDGVYRSTLAGKFLTVNPALVQIFGYASTEELLAADIPHDFFYQPETRQAWIEEILQKGELRNVEATVKRKDGQPIVVLENCRVIRDAQGAAMYLEGTLSDITEIKQREREIQAVAAVSAALRAATTRNEMLPIILDQVQQFLNSDALSLNTRDPLTGETVIELARGKWAFATGTRIPPQQGIAARVLDSRQPYLTNDLQNDPLFYWKNLIGDLRGYIGMPLIVQDRAIGVLSIGCHYAIAPEQVNVLKAIADIAASALHRATLHEKTEQRLQHLVALRTVDQTINASLDLRFTLDVLLDQTVTQLRVDAADVLLRPPAFQTLDYVAGRGFRTKEIERLSLRLGEGYAGKVALERRTLTIRNLAASQETGRATILAGEGFVAYCGVPLIAKGQVTGVLEVFHRAPFIADPDWINLLEMLAGQAALAIDNARLFENLQRSSANLVQSYDATIEGWSRALELRDPVTEGHTRRVAELTEQLARAVGIGEAELVHLRRGALLHDIGKIAVPDHILLKETGLTEDEWVIMRRHPEFAYELLRPIPYLQPALDIPHYHHEKWDGSGYPRGLQGEAIPLPARILALVDVWDALRSDRPYRAAWGDGLARECVRAQAGTHFDPNLVERFLKLAR